MEDLRLKDILREYLRHAQGRVVNLRDLRAELKIDPEKPAWETLGREMRQLAVEKIVRPSGRNDGVYKVVVQVKPVVVFDKSRERNPPFELIFPKDFDTGMEMDFANHIIIREGDVITLGGVKNKGKTLLCISFCGENIDKYPVLMGNEYTKSTQDKVTGELIHVPSPRFYNRLVDMDWINWVNGDGTDKFTLLPVKADYAEHIEQDRINIIDWINLDANQLYDIGQVIEDIKANLGRGVAIIALQKSASSDTPRGGQFAKDFTDCELLLDQFGDKVDDILLTVGEVKEKTKPVGGKTYAYTIWNGIKILNFREVVKCPTCYGKKWKKAGNTSIPCEECFKTGYIDK